MKIDIYILEYAKTASFKILNNKTLLSIYIVHKRLKSIFFKTTDCLKAMTLKLKIHGCSKWHNQCYKLYSIVLYIITYMSTHAICPVDWGEISMKQSVGKCKQINF